MSAVLSGCRRYRYSLSRPLPGGDHGPVLFIMLNPSTADETEDDPTIRRCLGFARAWGREKLLVGNLFALRATDPRELSRASQPIGEDFAGERNNEWLIAMAEDVDLVIAAWGVHGALFERGRKVREMLAVRGVQLHHLGLTKAGHPRHPLYLRGDTQPVGWGS